MYQNPSSPRSPGSTIPTESSDYRSEAEVLHEIWQTQYTQTYKIKYHDGLSKLARVQLLAGLIALCEGDVALSKRCVLAMFSDELRWVTNISLGWLCKPSNLSRFVLPVAQRATREGKVDWKKDRADTPSFRVRLRT